MHTMFAPWSRACANRLCGVWQADYLLDATTGYCIACQREHQAGTLVTIDPAHPKGPIFPSYAAVAPDAPCRWCGRAVLDGLTVFGMEGVYTAHTRCQQRVAGLDTCPSCHGPMESTTLSWCRTCDREPEQNVREAQFEERTGAPGAGAIGMSCGHRLHNGRGAR